MFSLPGFLTPSKLLVVRFFFHSLCCLSLFIAVSPPSSPQSRKWNHSDMFAFCTIFPIHISFESIIFFWHANDFDRKLSELQVLASFQFSFVVLVLPLFLVLVSPLYLSVFLFSVAFYHSCCTPEYVLLVGRFLPPLHWNPSTYTKTIANYYFYEQGHGNFEKNQLRKLCDLIGINSIGSPSLCSDI